MKPGEEQLLDELEAICGRGVLDSFAGFVRTRIVADDAHMAELIEVDGRAMLAGGRMIELDRYIEAVPDLERMPISLDAAIEFTLRSWTRTAAASDDPVTRMVARYPGFSRSIRNSAALSEGVLRTLDVEREVRGERTVRRDLPCGFGPSLRDGVQRYELRKLLGEGSQGAVYLAADRAMSDAGNEAMVAIKVLDSRPMSEGERWRRMDEATKARRVTHDNVVRVLDRGWSDDREYIIYEYIAGGDLDTWVQNRGGLTAREAADVVCRLARGVHAAHAAGLVHRDLKPGNVLMAARPGVESPEPKITDFGVADRTGPRELGDERSRSPVGNIAFIAPEQYRCEENESSIPVDVYALGGILFYLLTNRLPNGASASEIAGTHDAELGRRAAPAMTGAVSGVDAALVSICQRAMAPGVEERYSSAESFAADLLRWLANEPIGWQRPGPRQRLRLLTRRQPRAVAMTAVAAAAVIAGAAATMWTWAYASAWAAAESTARANAGKYFEAASHEVARGQQTDIAGNWFPALNALESIVGPYVFDPRKVGREPKSAKFRLAVSAISALRSNGKSESLEALLWSDTLAFWLLKSGDYERAEGFLAQTERPWNAKLAADDPWRMNHRAMRAGASAQRLMKRIAVGERVERGEPAAIEVEGSLRDAERFFTADRYGDTMHRFVLGCLVQLYDANALNDPEQLRWAEGKVERIRRDLLSSPNALPDDVDFSSSTTP